MKSLTFSPEQQTPKDDRRADYARRDRSQDHGTRGVYGDLDNPRIRIVYRTLYTRPTAERDAVLGDLSLEESSQEASDILRDKISSRQLKVAADAILKASGFVDQEPEVSFLETPSPDELREIEAYAWRNVDDGSEYIFDGEAYPADEIMGNDHDAEFEINAARRTRRQQAMNADRVYQGHINPDDAIVDFESGMHITDRP